MNRKIYKIVILLSVSVLIFFLKTDNSKGCGWFPEPDSYYSIFVPKLFKLPLLKPFFLTDYKFFPYDTSSSLGERTDNLKAWKKHFQNIPSIADINKILYTASKEDLEKIKDFISTGHDTFLDNKYYNNSLISFWKKHNYSNDIDYLFFIKKCEPYVKVTYDTWGGISAKRDTAGMADLIKVGEKRHNECKNNFLRDRYAFQVIRLLHYSYHYKEAINYYEKYFGGSKNSLIKYWALEHKAGCLDHLGQNAKANYIFAEIFQNCLSRRIACSQSFGCRNDSVFNATLALCKNADEKATVILLYGYDGDNVNVPSMKKIYSLNPKSDYLELLLERGISQMEREILPTYYENAYYESLWYNGDNFGRSIIKSYDAFDSLVIKIAAENKTSNPFIWDFAAGYISTLIHKNKEAEEFLAEAKKLSAEKQHDYTDRVRIVEVINKVDGLKKMDSSSESGIIKDLKWLRDTKSLDTLKSQAAFYYIMSLLRAKYLAQHDTIKAELCMGTKVKSNDQFNNESAFGYDIRRDFYREPLQKIYNFLTAKNLTLFDRFLVANYVFTSGQIREMIATKYLMHYNFKTAIKILSNNSKLQAAEQSYTLKNLPADPFVIHINDCHDCDYKAPKEKTYNKKTFAERMIELKKLAETDTANRAKYYFLLANGYYNITFFGNSWQAVAYDRTFPGWVFKTDTTEPKQYYNCSTAQEYYVKAMNTARDKEFAAKCCFMASKCEQNEFYVKAYNYQVLRHNPQKYFEIKNRYRNFFRTLQNKYSDTKYYQQVIDECKYFDEFVKNN